MITLQKYSELESRTTNLVLFDIFFSSSAVGCSCSGKSVLVDVIVEAPRLLRIVGASAGGLLEPTNPPVIRRHHPFVGIARSLSSRPRRRRAWPARARRPRRGPARRWPRRSSSPPCSPRTSSRWPPWAGRPTGQRWPEELL